MISSWFQTNFKTNAFQILSSIIFESVKIQREENKESKISGEFIFPRQLYRLLCHWIN